MAEQSAQHSEPGDLSAAELFREHGAFVARFLFRLGVPADAIEDSVQDVFLVVHQRGGYRKGPAKPTSYLALIACNAASEQRRKARARAARADGTEPDELTSRAYDPVRTLESRDALERLQAALDKLEPELRATLLLADGEEETGASIADAMGVPVGTVYWRLHMARKKFQRALAAVDASWKGPRAAEHSARERAGTPVLARSARMLGMFAGWGLPSWRGSEAQALRETAKQMPVEFDVQVGLLRHTQAVARLPVTTPLSAAPTPPSAGAFGSTASVLKTGLLVTAGGALLVTALQLALPGKHAVMSSAVATASAHGAEQSAALAPQVEAVHAPVHTQSAPAEAAVHDASVDEPQPTRNARPQTAGKVAAGAKARSVDTLLAAHGSRIGTRTGAGSARTLPHAARAGARPPSKDAQALARDAERAPEEKPAAPASAQPAASSSFDEVAEAQALGRADRLLQTDPAQALALVRKVAIQDQTDYLVEERRYIEVMALYGLSRQGEAQRAADTFLAAYPNSVFRERVKRARSGAYEAR